MRTFRKSPCLWTEQALHHLPTALPWRLDLFQCIEEAHPVVVDSAYNQADNQDDPDG